MKFQCRTLCLIEKGNIICDNCGISLNKRLYRNKRIALSLNSKANSGFRCIHCVLNYKNTPTLHRTIEQINQFLKDLKGDLFN